LEEICEIPIRFDAFSAKIGAKIAKFQWFCLKFMKMSPKFATKICWIVEVGEVQRNINLVDLAKSFQTSIYLQKSASIQPRTSYLIFFNFPSLQGFNFHRPPAPGSSSPAFVSSWLLKSAGQRACPWLLSSVASRTSGAVPRPKGWLIEIFSVVKAQCI
jgi:hypothetical protein